MEGVSGSTLTPVIPAPLPSAAPGIKSVSATGDTGSPATETQIYETLPFQRSSIDTLGIRFPNSPGDLETILAEISLALEKQTDEARANKIKSDTASRGSLIGSILASQLQSVVLAGQIQTLNGQKAKLETDIKTVTDRITETQGQRSAAIHERDEINKTPAKDQTQAQKDRVAQLNSDISGYDSSIANDQATLSTLNTQLADVKQDITTATTAFEALQVAMLGFFAALARASGDTNAPPLQDDSISASDRQTSQHFEDLFDTLKQISSGQKDLIVNETRLADLKLDDIDLENLAKAVIGLATGIIDLINTLQGFAPPPDVSASEAALNQGSRLKVLA